MNNKGLLNVDTNVDPIYQKYLNNYAGMTNEQQKIFDDYFRTEQKNGCGKIGGMSKGGMSKTGYLDLVVKKGEKFVTFDKVLSKLGVDEDEVNEIPPYSFGGFDYYGKEIIQGKLGFTNKYQITWLLFSDTQVYLYSFTFDMLSGTTRESCEEYFYKDVTNITTTQNQREIIVYTNSGCGGAKTTSKSIEIYNTFKIIVPGDTLECGVVELDDNLLNKIQATKAKIREKKNQ